MKKLFIHNALFRLLSPLFSGTLVYLLILLINNNIGQLQEAFLGQELYVCIGLAYLIQEYARLSLLIFEKIKKPTSLLFRFVLQLLTSVGVCIALVSLAMYLYFYFILGYSPNNRELLIFNSIFAVITLIYVVLYTSHQFLYKVNTERLARELAAKEGIEADFREFKRGINPELLFESLEALLVLMKKQPEKAEQLSDEFSTVYRYLLSKRMRELVPLETELNALKSLADLLNYLPYRKMKLIVGEKLETWVVPGSLLFLAERIIRSTIPSKEEEIQLNILENNEQILIKYEPEETLRGSLGIENLEDIALNYSFYSNHPIRLFEEPPYKIIELPKLSLNESSHH